jgi:fumarate hydratase subunit alpha
MLLRHARNPSILHLKKKIFKSLKPEIYQRLMIMREDKIEEVATELLTKAAIFLPNDVKTELKRAYQKENSEMGKSQLRAILENIAAAEQLNKPVCQDTGIISFFVKGRTVDYKKVELALRRATVKATKFTPLRPNAVHPITRINTGDNTGVNIPGITWLYEDVNYIEITVALKGFGSENTTALHMLPPGEGVKGLKRVVLETAVRAGGQPCPPVILNIGIGGTVDLTFKMAKLAMIRPLGVRHPEEAIAKLEREILELVNQTGIGPMGLGGKITALDVKIEYAHSHTGSLPIGINFQCWADRRATARIHSDGSVEIVK